MQRSHDRTSGRIKQTKIGNKGMHRLAIEPVLLTLLRTMHAEAGGQGPSREHASAEMVGGRSAKTPKPLELAGITREALFNTDDTQDAGSRLHRVACARWISEGRYAPITMNADLAVLRVVMTIAKIELGLPSNPGSLPRGRGR